MPNINQGHGRLTWWLLFESARRARKNLIPLDERKIQLISPWIRDIPIDGSMWDPIAISCALGNNANEVELLSDVLAEMTKTLHFKIQICIRDQIDRTVTRSNSVRVDQEFLMLDKLQRSGVQTLKTHQSHKKMLITPIGAITGSMNFTYAGTRINRENTHFYFKNMDLEGYEQAAGNAQRELDGAMPYFENQIISWPETVKRYETVIGMSEIEELTNISPQITVENIVSETNTTSPTMIVSPKMLFQQIVFGEDYDVIPEHLHGHFNMNMRRWEMKLREVIVSLYSLYIPKSKQIRKWAKINNEEGKLRQKWHRYVSTKVVNDDPFNGPIPITHTDEGKLKVSVWTDCKSISIGHHKKYWKKKYKDDDITPELILPGTDLKQLLIVSGLYHVNDSEPGYDAANHHLFPVWCAFMQECLSVTDSEAKRLYRELSLHAMRIYEARNPDGHANPIPYQFHKDAAEGINKFYDRLFNPFDAWVEM